MSYCSPTELAGLGFGAYGDNVLISRQASLYRPELIRIGSNVRIDDFCILSAGAEGIDIGSHVHIACFSSLIGKGNIALEDFSNISSRVSIFSSNDDYSGESMTNPMIPDRFKKVSHGPVRVGQHAIIGCGAIVLPNITLGTGVCIGALSLVTRDCEEFGMYTGIPAKFIKSRSRKLLQVELDFRSDA